MKNLSLVLRKFFRNKIIVSHGCFLRWRKAFKLLGKLKFRNSNFLNTSFTLDFDIFEFFSLCVRFRFSFRDFFFILHFEYFFAVNLN